MTRAAALLLTLVLLCSVSLAAPGTTSSPSSTVMLLVGTVTNLTVAKSTGVTFTITPMKDGTYRAQGSYDGKNLFGKFNVPGRVISAEGGHRALQFAGYIEFGDDGSGFPAQTRTQYVMTILLSKEGVQGVYRIGELPSFGIEFEQYGILQLTMRR